MVHVMSEGKRPGSFTYIVGDNFYPPSHAVTARSASDHDTRHQRPLLRRVGGRCHHRRRLALDNPATTSFSSLLPLACRYETREPAGEAREDCDGGGGGAGHWRQVGAGTHSTADLIQSRRMVQV